MKVITANLNGIRSAERKGFFKWMVRQQADVVCIQETKAQAPNQSSECWLQSMATRSIPVGLVQP